MPPASIATGAGTARKRSPDARDIYIRCKPIRTGCKSISTGCKFHPHALQKDLRQIKTVSGCIKDYAKKNTRKTPKGSKSLGTLNKKAYLCIRLVGSGKTQHINGFVFSPSPYLEIVALSFYPDSPIGYKFFDHSRQK